MTTQHDIEALRERITRAQHDCESWRQAGPEERYLESYVIVKALELELEEKLCQPTR